jgi:Xaa-Pro dipeptidase
MISVFQKRLQCLIDYMEESGIDVAMVTTPSTIFYFTGFRSNPYERFLALFVDQRSKRCSLIVPALDFDAARQSTFIENVIPVQDHESPYVKMQELIGQSSLVLGIEKNQVSLLRYESIREHLNASSIVDIGSSLSDMRSIKDEEEAKYVREAVRLIENVLEDSIKKIKVGITELELSTEFDYLMRKYGADGPAFQTTVLSGKRSALPHGSSSNFKINQRDFLLIDMGISLNGYCSDITRTFIIGEPSEEQKKIYASVLTANKQAIQAVQIGEKIGEIDIAARKVIAEQGYSCYFNNRTGHGLGIDVHEEPSIHSKNESLIKPGLLFTIEPGIYIPEIGGVRIEDNIYIKNNGEVESLTQFPKDLIILE